MTLGKNGKLMGRPPVEKSMKRKGRPISMSDFEYSRAVEISKASNMSLSEKVRFFFDKEEEDLIKKGEL